VAESVSMTIRTLDRRFEKSLGRSVHNEIIRMRIEQACHMLVETNLSISQIAFNLGYTELKHLTQAFKREKGIGPLAYRRTYGNV
jgi:LacI family transcriptional regulator